MTELAAATLQLAEAHPAEVAAAAPDVHRPHLDGLRAIAVFAVVVFHAGADRVSGGFVGVDVFFVLSGYLVTGVLIGDVVSRGKLRIARFYARRVRRLLPAAFGTLVVTALVHRAVATPLELHDSVGGFRAAFVYSSNWYFAGRATDYFATDVAASPVLHFWSLAVEEQFYILWPALFAVLMLATRWAGRHWRRAIAAVVAIGGLGSLVRGLLFVGSRDERAYFGTDTRAYQLLLGATIALVPVGISGLARRDTARRVLAWCALGTVVLLVTSAISMGVIARGVAAAAATAIALIALDAGPGAARGLLSLSPLTYLGRISYGIYLWHWPILIWARHRDVTSPRALVLIGGVGATVLAAVSAHLIELPIRRSPRLDRVPRTVVASGLVAGLVGGLVLVPRVLGGADDATRLVEISDPVAAARSEGELRDWLEAWQETVVLPSCLRQPAERCVLRRGEGPHVMVVGDSTARMWVPAFGRLADRHDLTFSVAVMGGCPWQRGLNYGGSVEVRHQCDARRDDWYERVIPRLDPDILVLVQRGHDDPTRPSRLMASEREVLEFGSPGFLNVLTQATDRSLAELRAPGRRIVVIEPVPIPPSDLLPLACLARDRTGRSCTFQAPREPTPSEHQLRMLAATGSLISIDLDGATCPRLPMCDAFIGDIITYRDNVHLTVTYARSLWPAIESSLRDHGIDLDRLRTPNVGPTSQ